MSESLKNAVADRHGRRAAAALDVLVYRGSVDSRVPFTIDPEQIEYLPLGYDYVQGLLRAAPMGAVIGVRLATGEDVSVVKIGVMDGDRALPGFQAISEFEAEDRRLDYINERQMERHGNRRHGRGGDR